MKLKKAKSVDEIEKLISESSASTEAMLKKINGDISKVKEKIKTLKEEANEYLEKEQKKNYENALNEIQSNNYAIEYLKKRAEIVKTEQPQIDDEEIKNIMKEIRLAEAVVAVESYNTINVLLFNALYELKQTRKAIGKLEDLALRLHRKKGAFYTNPTLGTYPSFSEIQDLYKETSIESTMTIVQEHFKTAAPDDYQELLALRKQKEIDAKRKAEKEHEEYLTKKAYEERPMRKVYKLFIPDNLYGTVGIETTWVDAP